jgi:hypothetical protein
MNTQTNEDLLIGRINRKEEKALGISLTSSVLIYVQDADLNRMAAKRPNTYLADLEEIGSIIKTPDYVLYRDDEEQFYFVREYLRNHDFQKILVKVAHLGTPKRWELLSVSRTSIEEMRADDIRYGYAKIKA